MSNSIKSLDLEHIINEEVELIQDLTFTPMAIAKGRLGKDAIKSNIDWNTITLSNERINDIVLRAILEFNVKNGKE